MLAQSCSQFGDQCQLPVLLTPPQSEVKGVNFLFCEGRCRPRNGLLRLPEVLKNHGVVRWTSRGALDVAGLEAEAPVSWVVRARDTISSKLGGRARDMISASWVWESEMAFESSRRKIRSERLEMSAEVG
jgi:hypothetical protein